MPFETQRSYAPPTSRSLGGPLKQPFLMIDPGVCFQVLYWLSGLTCTDENVIQKSGVQRDAAEKGVAIVACDTSPRKEAHQAKLVIQGQKFCHI